MNEHTLSLKSKISNNAQDIAIVNEFKIPINGHIPKIKKKKPVVSGATIAEHKDIKIGDTHSPIDGIVIDVSDSYISLKLEQLEEAPEIQPEKIDISNLSGSELLDALKKLGINIDKLYKAETLIINCINPEPKISIYDQILQDYSQTLEKGLEIVKKAVLCLNTTLAIPNGVNTDLTADNIVQIDPVYPNSIDQLVVKSVTGKENFNNICIISILDLFQIGKASETSLPVTETMISVGENNYIVKIGTPVKAILDHAAIKVNDGDSLIIGGPMKGVAIHDINQGIGKYDYGILVIPKDSFPPITNQACLNCGKCIQYCPASLMPNMITRFAEFELYDKAKEYDIDSCMEEGLCAYYCTARRPLLQLIKLAKSKIAEMENIEIAS